MQNLKTITVNAVTLPQVTYKGQPVLTTRALAELLGCKPHAVTVNFSRNQHKFVQGLDFIKINAVEARAAGLPHTTAKLVSQIETLELFRYSSQGVVLFTRRGLAKLSKSVGTPQAWAMMDTFIDAYFTLEGLATGSLSVHEGAAKAQEVVKRGQGLFAGIALQDTPSLPDGDHLRTAMALPRAGMPVVNEDINQEADALMFSLTQVVRRMKASAGHAKTLSAANNALTAKLDMAGETFEATHEALMAANARIATLESENAALRRVTGDLEKFNKIKDLLAS